VCVCYTLHRCASERRGNCISVLEVSLQNLVRFRAVSQLAVIESPTEQPQFAQRHPGLGLAGVGRHCK
jgi:hypothetical protein